MSYMGLGVSLSDVSDMKLDIVMPHVPERRDGDLKAVRTVDDIFTLLTFLDENLNISYYLAMLRIVRILCHPPDCTKGT